MLGMVDYAQHPEIASQTPPQTGLIGSEQALNQGLTGSSNALIGGMSTASNLIDTGAKGAINSLGVGASNATRYLTGLQGNGFSANTSVGADVTNPLNEASSNFQGYLGGGQNAAKLQADLSGANGQQAQQAAYSQYQSSPAMQYQMDQMQKATERSAAARGGLLGGNVLQALQQNAAGIASQDYQNQFSNLGQVANQGLTAATQVAGLKSTQAGIAGQLQNAGIQANLQASLADQQQKLSVAQHLSDLANQYGINTANILGGASQTKAQNAYNTGLSLAGNMYNTGTNLASGRIAAGNSIAQNASNAATNIGNLLSQQGINLSNGMTSDINNVTNILAQYGLNDQRSNENLATIIGNITGGQASNTQQAYNNIGAANAAGTMGINSAVQGGVQNAIMLGALSKGVNGYASPSETWSQMQWD